MQKLIHIVENHIEVTNESLILNWLFLEDKISPSKNLRTVTSNTLVQFCWCGVFILAHYITYSVRYYHSI